MRGSIQTRVSAAGPFDPISVHISSIIQNNCQIMYGSSCAVSLATAINDDTAVWSVYVMHCRRPLFAASSPSLMAAYIHLHRQVSRALAAHLRRYGFTPPSLDQHDNDDTAAWLPEDACDVVFTVRRAAAHKTTPAPGRPPPPVDGYAPSPPAAYTPDSAAGRYSSKPDSAQLLPPLPPLGSVVLSPMHGTLH